LRPGCRRLHALRSASFVMIIHKQSHTYFFLPAGKSIRREWFYPPLFWRDHFLHY
jgi:hypothetical protein